MTKRQLHRYHTHMLACATRGIEPPSVVKVEICLFAVCHLGVRISPRFLHKTKMQLHRYLTHMLTCAARGVEPPSVVYKVEVLFAVSLIG